MKTNRKKRALGAVYTPELLANWAATLLVRQLQSARPLIVDPSCGDGALLGAVAAQNGSARLVGVDIDRTAISRAQAKLSSRVRLKKGDALMPARAGFAEGWKHLLGGRLADGIIANPPWGGAISHSPASLARVGFKLAKGQFDSFDLFVEMALRITRKGRGGGICVFILPDSLFLPEHQALRELLVGHTTILTIARLGEGLFAGVYRGTTVLVLKNVAPKKHHEIVCLRLSKQWRTCISSGLRSFRDAEQQLSHKVPQSRFLKDPHCRFDIDLRERERAPIVKLEANIDGWTDWLESGRGVELSKAGEIVFCSGCNRGFPMPREPRGRTCPKCNADLDPATAKRGRIILPLKDKVPGWLPLIVGEDVDRFRARPSRCIKLGIEGINYKNEEMFRGSKILVRKTGVGLKAAIDETNSLTNQVVFIYSLRATLGAPDFLLLYFLGVLNSRVMLAYHLKKSGENEWRSHPYVTQRTISELPIPNVKPGTQQWAQAQAIGAAVQRVSRTYSIEADLYLEGLVAGLFGLSDADCRWVGNVIDAAQSLEAIRTLRLSANESFNPITV